MSNRLSDLLEEMALKDATNIDSNAALGPGSQPDEVLKGEQDTKRREIVTYRSATADVLCQYCQAVCEEIKTTDIVKEWTSSRQTKFNMTLRHGKTLSQLLVPSDCHLCTAFRTCITSAITRSLATHPHAGLQPLLLHISRFDDPLIFSPWEMKLQFEGVLLEIPIGEVIRLTRSCPAQRDRQTRRYSNVHLQTYTGSQDHLNLVKSWLSQCEMSHELCSKPTTRAGYLPSRLIDVSPGSDWDCRIYLTPEKLSGLRYTALSHCWGKQKMLTLRPDNLDRLTKGFNISDLPPTFRDAITITRSLNIRYLWIDSLCILQDSESDWKLESPYMASVFENAICSIANLHGVDSYTGIFKERNPLEHLPCELTKHIGTHLGPSAYPMYATSSEIDWDLWSESDPSPESTRAPALHTRGWVVQERVAAVRTLNFSSRRVFFECRSSKPRYATTENPELTLNAPRLSNRKNLSGLELKQLFNVFRDQDLHPVTSSEDRKLFFMAWHTFVNAYTFGRLTFQDDRLMALQGVVTVIEESLGLTCIFGLWKELLALDIMWRRINHALFVPQNVCESNEKRAPSWSWIKLDTGVDCHSIAQHSDVHVYAVSFRFHPPEGEITIPTLNEPPHCLSTSAPLHRFVFDDLKLDKFQYSGTLQDSLEVIEVWPDEPHLAQTLIGRELHLLFICCEKEEIEDGIKLGINVGLILERLPETQSYRRVGLFEDEDRKLSVPSEVTNVMLY